MYKDCHIKRINIFFKQAARHKKSWRYEKYMKKINHIRPTSYKFVRKVRIMQENQPAAAEEVSAEEFHYEELTPDQVDALY
jgi:hypothetical protein